MKTLTVAEKAYLKIIKDTNVVLDAVEHNMKQEEYNKLVVNPLKMICAMDDCVLLSLTTMHSALLAVFGEHYDDFAKYTYTHSKLSEFGSMVARTKHDTEVIAIGYYNGNRVTFIEDKYDRHLYINGTRLDLREDVMDMYLKDWIVSKPELKFYTQKGYIEFGVTDCIFDKPCSPFVFGLSAFFEGFDDFHCMFDSKDDLGIQAVLDYQETLETPQQ